MYIRIGLSNNDLTSRIHQTASFRSTEPLLIETGDAHEHTVSRLPPGKTLVVSATGAALMLTGLNDSAMTKCSRLRIATAVPQAEITVSSLMRSGAGGKNAAVYKGSIEVSAADNGIRLILLCEPDSYLQGVLGSEMPCSYSKEALKAQAVTARTYGLHPRIDHTAEGFNVCDSFLCCQNFTGNAQPLNEHYAEAIASTHNEILTCKDVPILALFSSCAGGHTESYENCFSDPVTQEFPPQPIPYLQGVAEGHLQFNLGDEGQLKQFYTSPKPDTCDSWSPHFRWQIALPADSLESHMHHIVATMLSDNQFASFIKPPASQQFGHIEKFAVPRRGSAGTAINMVIYTSAGQWTVLKELVIRSVFKNPDMKLTRLQSARIFFKHERDKLGLLSTLVICGLGWGHGVGFQQTGAQGLALSGINYREILSHYYKGATIQRL